MNYNFNRNQIGKSGTQEDMIMAMAEVIDDVSVQELYKALPKTVQEEVDDRSLDAETKYDYNFNVIEYALRSDLFWRVLNDLDEKDSAKQCEAMEQMVLNKPDESYFAEKDGKKYILDVYYLAKFERRQVAYVEADLRISNEKAIEVMANDYPLDGDLEEINEWIKEKMLTDPWNPAPWQHDSTSDLEKKS